MANPQYVTFKKWAGFRIRGTEVVEPPTTDRHIDRAFFLVSKLEAPKWGGVQSYDGVAMSGGPLHNIAVYRDGRQASLWGLLRRIELGVDHHVLADLWDALGVRGWYVSQDSRLRDRTTGKLVPGKDIIEEFSGPRGKTPRSGPQAENAKRWIRLFHELFANPDTFRAQKEYAINWLLDGHEELESEAYRKATNGQLLSGRDAADTPMYVIGEEADLALCVYHAHSVNAPGKAKQILKAVLRMKSTDAENFPQRLIKRLGTAKYARWADTTDNKNRYDRTRIHATRSKLWSPNVISRLMPKNF